ncbi:hypothetical protein J4E83_004961 [Alternaria metachromatica]|uniref:uncharacterized protein n=1 Tax=Alternaria metachromatica TaxID=283354 RepID=UPI0020C4A820|nr:uncharacterized protein J4E83_004961 [Alternaria metachromatica]KAI4622221.1 hypothetical protein J4E83_004961 [Alternaria metachromatica]
MILAISATARFVIYADEWHPTRPDNPRDRAGIDHVILAFAPANATATFQPKVPIHTIRTEFPNAKVMIAVGGWGDTVGFCQATKSDASMLAFAADVATMLARTGADGVEDIDWEYPGGNGADYKQVANWDQTYQIAAFPKLLAAIRAAIGKKLLSIAVPGKEGQSSYTFDMLGYTRTTGPQIWPSVDFINVMSYDLMNRRDTVTKHHSSAIDAENSIKDYLAMGAPPSKLNLGFAYYAKYFTTQGDCSASPLNCPIAVAEDAQGKDTLTSGAWTFERLHMHPVDASSLTISRDGTCGPEKGTKCETGCCSQHGHCGTSPEHCNGACQHAFGTGCTDADVAASWQLAAKHGVTDEVAGGQYYFDATNRLFWTWDTPELITRKFDNIVRKYKLGGIMAWSLGEDSADWGHIRQMAKEVVKGGLGLTTASDSNMPVDAGGGYLYDEIAHYCCPNGYDPANLLIYQPGYMFPLSYHPFLVHCGDGKGLIYCACDTPECSSWALYPGHYDGHESVQPMLNEDGLVEMQYTEALQAMPTEHDQAALETPRPHVGVMTECLGEGGATTWCPLHYTNDLPSMPTETSPAAIETSWPTDAIIIECMGENGGLTWCPQSYTDEALSSMSKSKAAALQTPSPTPLPTDSVFLECLGENGGLTSCGVSATQDFLSKMRDYYALHTPTPTPSPTPSRTSNVHFECTGVHGGLTRCPHSVMDNFVSNKFSLDAAGLETPRPVHQNPTAVMTAAAIETGFTTHIGIPQAPESELPGGSYGMRRRERAHKA